MGREETGRVPLPGFGGPQTREHSAIPFALVDYLELVDWSRRAIRFDKCGTIDACLPPIMRRLNIDTSVWQETTRPQGNVFGRALGHLAHLREHAQALGQSWVRGLHQAERLYRHG
jgi:hypothetical protein